MVLGCGLSKKTNKKVNSTFLYFWYYKNGKKNEQYLGKVDDPEANQKGFSAMLAFYKNQDDELHQIIKKLESQIKSNKLSNSLIPAPYKPPKQKKPDYLPDFED